MGKKTPKTAHSPWDFVTPLEQDQATAIGNMHKKFAKIMRVVQVISSQTDRQTDRKTQTCSAGEATKLTTELQLV